MFVPIAARFAVIVVPIFSPRIIAQAVGKLNKPELAMTIVAAIIAEDDWNIMVKNAPIPMHIKRFKMLSGLTFTSFTKLTKA